MWLRTLDSPPCSTHNVGIIVLPLIIPIFIMISELDVGSFRVDDAYFLSRSDAAPCPLINRIDHINRHHMRGRSQDFRGDEGHPLNLDVPICKYWSAIAHQD